MRRPPRLAESLLRLILGKGLRGASTLGDLEAEFHGDVEARGWLAARVRYWGGALSLLWHRLLAAVRRRVPGLGLRLSAKGTPDGHRIARGDLIGGLFLDGWYAVRSLVKEPGWTAATLATLTIGIGATTAIFTVVNAVLLRPLDFPAPDRLVLMEFRPADSAGVAEWAGFNEYMSEHMRHHVTFPSFETWRGATADVFEDVGAYDDAWTYDVGFGADAGTERLAGTIVTAGLLRALGVAPLRGRLFGDAADEPGAEPAVLLSYGLWMRRFGGDASIVGRTITIQGRPHSVAGVMPRDFAFPAATTEVWISMASGTRGAGSTNYSVVGRVREDIPVDRARAAVEARTVGLPVADGPDRRYGARLANLRGFLVGEARPLLLLFLSSAGVLLLIACVNVVNLMLTRATRRAHERVVRAALGASPARIARLLFTESVMVSVLGALLGLALAFGLVAAFLKWAPEAFPRQEGVAVDLTVLLFSLGLATVVGILVGLVPAFQASRMGIRVVLNEATRGTSPGARSGRFRDSLVVLQLALALMLLVGGGLLTRSLAAQLDEETGFDPGNVLTLTTSLPRSRYASAADAERFFDRLLAEVRALPGVRSAAAATYAPASGFFHSNSVEVEGYTPAPAEAMEMEFLQVTPQYFAAMGMTILEGRDFDERDDIRGPQVVAVSESLARAYFPDGRALGGRIRVDGEWRTVVAIIGDVLYRGAKRRAPVLYEPYAVSNRRGGRALFVRTAGGPELLAPSVSRLVASMDPEVTVYGVGPLETHLWEAVSGPRLRALLVGAFAAASLLLAVVGVYGVMTYAVGRRTREMGIRRVLGARPEGIVRHVTRRGLVLTTLGIAIGVAGSLPVGGTLRSYLYRLEPTDPLTFGLAIAILALASTAACLIPALRASRVDPLVALRSE